MKHRVVYLVLALIVGVLSASIVCAKPERVLVIINQNSPESVEIGEYYASKRNIPARNVLKIKCRVGEGIEESEYRNNVEKPIREYLARTGLDKTVDYFVLTKGVPIRVLGLNRSLDGMLMGMDMKIDVSKLDEGVPNPYYSKNERFSRKKFGIYLSTRLDGYTVAHAKALVDRSLAAKPERGVFLIDSTPKRNSGGYRIKNLHMGEAHRIIVRKGFISIHEDTAEFVGGRTNLMGYFSWGSNDHDFNLEKYRSNRFSPGAIAETAVSTSARTFNRTEGGQSMIADLIESGVTGVKGYVTEPTLNAVADPRVLFDRYLSGYNLADSYYMASRWILWKDIVIGDPLCAPYAK